MKMKDPFIQGIIVRQRCRQISTEIHLPVVQVVDSF